MPVPYPRLLALSLMVVAMASCQEAPAPGADQSSDPAPAGQPVAETLPLLDIMRGLEEDLAETAHGFWVEDLEIISSAATGVAEHPRVPQEQMLAIQAELGDEFPTFVQMDRQVHDLAVELAAAADSAQTVSAGLFGSFVDVQRGCISCHTAYRARVSGALAREAEGAPVGTAP